MEARKNVTACHHCKGKIPKVGNRSDRKFCSDRCKQAGYRKRKTAAHNPVQSLVRGDNAALIKEVARLYANNNPSIADVTYGSGSFWRRSPSLDVTGSDLLTVPERPYDFRDLPYADDSFNIVVFDPPYLVNPGDHYSDDRYKNSATTKGMSYNDIRALYRGGMAEAKRVARKQIWVKCKDQINGNRQCWLHVHVLNDAESIGLIGKDLFILDAAQRAPDTRWTTQHHARKSMSYLWILDVPKYEAS